VEIAMTVKALLAKSAFPIILLGAAAAISAQTAPPVEPAPAELPMPPAEIPSPPIAPSTPPPEGMHLAPANVLKGTEAMLRPTPIVYPRCTAAIQDSCISTSAGVDVKLMARAKRMVRHHN
jgi:hypothetical protein